MTVLVTGYEPFGDATDNPSARVAERLDGGSVAGHDVVGRVLPVEFDAAANELLGHYDDHDPAAVVSTGEAAGRSAVCVERLGVNVEDSGSTADNAGVERFDDRVDPDGPAAYFSTLPVVDAVERILDAGIPARVSNDAGTHCCNHLLYATRHRLAARGDDVPVGFLHLPLTPAMAAERGADGATSGGGIAPSLPLDLQGEAVATAVEAALSD